MVLNIFGEATEKVAVKSKADLQQLVGADVVAFEQTAQVLPRATHLPGEPGDAALLECEFRFNKLADMWCFVHKKGVNPFSCSLYHPLGSGKPV